MVTLTAVGRRCRVVEPCWVLSVVALSNPVVYRNFKITS